MIMERMIAVEQELLIEKTTPLGAQSLLELTPYATLKILKIVFRNKLI
jgi:hypothetical protein